MESLDLTPLYQSLTEIDPSCGLPVYSSLDIRDSGYKLCAVDVNLFPAGFNNIGEDAKANAGRKMKSFFSAKLMKSAPWRIVVIPEAHTNNAGYLENLADIKSILELAGAQVKVMWSGPAIPKPWTIKTKSGKELEYLPREAALENADALLLNHDMSGGIPEAIRDLSLPMFPSPKLGWYQRKKSTHFEIVDGLLRKLSEKHPSFDPWFFSSRTKSLGDLNMDESQDLDKIVEKGNELFDELEKEYSQRKIDQRPYVFLKNDAGTYGMGVLSFENREELSEAANKIKKKLRVGKESVKVNRVILQEGVPSAYTGQGGKIAAEPVVYMVHGSTVGGFYRVHRNLSAKANTVSLNQPGSTLEALDSDDFELPRGKKPDSLLEKGGVYHFLARLHAIAAALEECP